MRKMAFNLKFLVLFLGVVLTFGVVTSASDAKSLEIGDTFIFGRYEQDNNYSNGKEPIEWIVLDKKKDEVLLISKYCLETRQYKPLPFLVAIFMSVSWEDCELRKWLNSSFLHDAFDSKEQEKISKKRISNLDNTKYNTKGGRDTEDSVFLLSINEAVRYFSSNGARQASPTLYALNKEPRVEKGFCMWWLRSPGYSSIHVAEIDCDGSMSYWGAEAQVEFIAVRPALWLDISK